VKKIEKIDLESLNQQHHISEGAGPDSTPHNFRLIIGNQYFIARALNQLIEVLNSIMKERKK